MKKKYGEEIIMSRKSLRDISWDVSEEEYRADPALSYSTLARFEREGFNNLDKLFDRIETPSLTFGSAVDSIITGGQEEFDERFMVAEYPSLSDNLTQIARTLFNRYGEQYSCVEDIPEEVLAEIGKECDFYAGDKYANYRVKLIKENCGNYFNLMYLASGRTILDTKTYNDVVATVNVLKTSEGTKFYFAQDNPFEPDIERLYQLKFKGTFNGVTYRNMADLIVVNHKEKWVLPIDLKTSGKPEWDFYKSFIDWRYDIQARLYWAIIRQNMDKDEYFKDFKLKEYLFIVANRRTLTPLVWHFSVSSVLEGNLYFGANKQIICRSPLDIGDELHAYLSSGHKVPKGIEIDKANSLVNWLYTIV